MIPLVALKSFVTRSRIDYHYVHQTLRGEQNLRTQTVVDAIADDYFDRYLLLNPLAATYLGVEGTYNSFPDLSPDGLAEMSALRRRTLASLEGAEGADSVDRVTIAALRESLSVAEELRSAGREDSLLRNIASPVQEVREIFDLMPKQSADDWSAIATRMSRVPEVLHGYARSLHEASDRGDISPRRQIIAVVQQLSRNGGQGGVFATLVESAPQSLAQSLRTDLLKAAASAREACYDLAEFLSDNLLPTASDRDAVGIDVYKLHSRASLGTVIDLAETYEWGQAELARITAEMIQLGDKILPGASLREVHSFLDADETRLIRGRGALVEWMQSKTDIAVEACAGTHFDIPHALRVIECGISPGGTGAITYTPPTEDFERPGRMWWDLPDGVDEFSTWRQLTTVYHEGVPGHHLQAAHALSRVDELNRWRRIGSWVSGHGEGWALYGEQLMAEIGFLGDPAEKLGMLDGQSMRAARVVLDIGIHCNFEAPAEIGGGSWTYAKAHRFLAAHCARDSKTLQFEIERYLGWPGQAPAYYVGKRLWLELRKESALMQGSKFELRKFHKTALDVGSVGLDVMRQAVLETL